MPSILITGANRGLGLELAKQYGEAGWRVFACCRDPGSAPELKRLGQASGGKISVHRLEVTDPSQITALAKELKGQPIDVLFNNAGVLGGPLDKPTSLSFGSLDFGAWEDVLKVNTIAPVRMAEAFVDHVAASERKLMVFMSTQMGSIAEPGGGGYYQYRSSKAALNMVTKALALDLKPRGVRTLALSPGWVATDMGTAAAPVKAPDSIRGMRKVIDGYGKGESGAFMNYEGARVPW